MSIETVRKALGGISGVHVTPYGADGEIDGPLLRQVVERIAAAGVHNIVAAGNTGEFFTLTPAEIRLVHEHVVAAARGRSLVTAAVGRSLKEAIAAARDAGSMGADAVMVHHPMDPFAAPSAQADYILAIADASPVPLVAYLRSDALGLENLMRIAAHENVAGIKYAATNLMLFSECVRASEGLPALWVCGLAEGWAAPFYALGARGFTSGLVNVAPERSLAIHAALERGQYDTARKLVAEIAGFEAMRAKYNNGSNVTVVKEAMTLAGIPVGPVRLPGLSELEPSDRDRLSEIVRDWQLSPQPAGLRMAGA